MTASHLHDSRASQRPTWTHLIPAAAGLLLIAFVTPLATCGSEPDTTTFNECLRELDCPAGQTCCNGLCVPVGTPCGTSGTDTVSPPDTAGEDVVTPDTSEQADTAAHDTSTPPDATVEDSATPPDTTGPCVPSCQGRVCGDDDCGGSCGTCTDPNTHCAHGQCVAGTPPVCVFGTSAFGDGCVFGP